MVVIPMWDLHDAFGEVEAGAGVHFNGECGKWRQVGGGRRVRCGCRWITRSQGVPRALRLRVPAEGIAHSVIARSLQLFSSSQLQKNRLKLLITYCHYARDLHKNTMS